MTETPTEDAPVERYETRTERSKAHFERSTETLPGGVGGSAPTYDPYPIAVDRAEGSRIWDLDGNEYVDFNLTWGVLAVGHSHPAIVDGLEEQLSRGTMYGFPHEAIPEVAENLADRFPIDAVRFTGSGTESTLYATRLARRFTGKDTIVKIEGAYHGVSDSLHLSKAPPAGKVGPADRPTAVPYGDGIPDGVQTDTVVAPFNDVEALSGVLDEHRGEVAAVIVEPVMMNAGVIPPDPGYLEEVRRLTERENVLLIFDEVKTGVKIAPGGAAEHYGVEPDLITLAKAIGGGLPLGAVTGSEEILDEIGDEGLFGTFSANPMAIRASKITLEEILTDDGYETMASLGEHLFEGYEDIIEDEGLDATVQYVNGVGGPIFSETPVRNYRDFLSVDEETHREYWLRMVNEGVIPMPYGAEEEALISVQHTREDVERHLEAFKTVASQL